MDTKVADPLRGALIAERYRVVTRLASGGMATVYEARDERLGRTVAIKIIHPEHAREQEFLDRLADEANTVARLTHPNVVAVYDQGMYDGAPYLVMELVRGRTLREILNERGRFDPTESLAVLEQILSALTAAHRAGLLHRDIKPENVLVAPPPNGSGDLLDAVVKVADFGLAGAVEAAGGSRRSGRDARGSRDMHGGRDVGGRDVGGRDVGGRDVGGRDVGGRDVGGRDVGGRDVGGRDVGGRERREPGRPRLLATAEYVAPELVSTGRADSRSDIYSAGIVLFEMLTGRVPFEGERPADVAWQHVDHDVPPPSRSVPGLPVLLDRVVARATCREPAGRPRDAAALLAEVQATREDIGALAGPTRALAHPTVLVNPVSHGRGSGAGDARPSWARLPASGRGQLAAARRRVAQLVPNGSLRAGMASFVSHLDRMRGTQRGRRQLISALVVIGLLLLVGGWWLGFGRYTDAPSLLQLTRANAIAEAERLGFSVDYGAGRFAEDVPIDTVMDQQPPVGSRIVRGGTITLILSLGPERYAVPEVAGQAAAVAMARLKEQPFVVQTVSGFSDTLPTNYVVGTDPEAGTLLKPNSVVKMIVAKGKYPVHVPSLVGKPLGEAENQLRAMGFDVEVQRKDDDTKPRDQVLEQTPAGGTGMAKATGKVVLVVANGPPGPPMPGVVGANCRQAIDHLRGMGLNVNVNGNDIERFFWRVLVQRPDPGQPVQPGQTVELECGS